MSAFTKVAVVGASGNLGPLVVKALLDVGFEVTAVTREESKATFPSEVVVKRVDLSSVESVARAVTGQDAIVSTVAAEATASQRVLIDAAITAHVQRFIPSEFGINTREARGTKFGRFVAPKIADVDYLIELSEKHTWFSWTGISTGAFFDWGLRNGFFGFDLKKKTCQIFDSGNEPFSGTNLAFIGKCVAASLEKAEETANKFLTVASFTVTQNEVLKVLEEETGSKFAVTDIKTSDLQKITDEKLARNDPTAFVESLIQYVFADGAKQAVEENAATAVLGLQEESLRATIKAAITELS
ncbi:NmrA-like family protein [Dactylonectria estremocensis]|uniref:NmrA-like family protein n=1 Tax=Dactylonectria estremocensis TaxID=1079267 RepID=A0A9P9DMP0_9HYPO|nr:NmrA-like family protein [Dactylonectria estremocensis]